jgi:hypothetical protein
VLAQWVSVSPLLVRAIINSECLEMPSSHERPFRFAYSPLLGNDLYLQSAVNRPLNRTGNPQTTFLAGSISSRELIRLLAFACLRLGSVKIVNEALRASMGWKLVRPWDLDNKLECESHGQSFNSSNSAGQNVMHTALILLRMGVRQRERSSAHRSDS